MKGFALRLVLKQRNKRTQKWPISNVFERTKRAVSLAREKGVSNWLTAIPNKDMDCDLNKREFKDAIHLRYNWEITGTPPVCVCGERFSVDHANVTTSYATLKLIYFNWSAMM